ncbi:MAG: TCR/Tet family MFS transporter [Pseudomonadota bacterium]
MSEAAARPEADAPPRALVFIFVAVALNSMGVGLIMPVMPDLLLELTTAEADVDALGRAAAWGGWLTFCYAFMQFLMSPTLGNLADAYGRRPVLLVSLFVMGVDYLAMAMTETLTLLFAARIMAGAASATFAVANAFIADISPPEKRAQNFGLTGAAFGVGFVLGPALGGLLGEFGPRTPFFAAAALSFANLIFGWLVLPESLKPEKRRPFALKRGNSIGVALAMRRYPAVAWMLFAVFVYNVSHYVYPVIWSYYAKLQFDWSPADIGLSLAVVGVGFAVAQGFLIRKIIPWLGAARTAILAFMVDVAALLGLAFATEGWMVYALIPLASLSALVAPAIQGLMSARIPDDAQGELQGAIGALTSLAFIVTPIVMSQIFLWSTSEDAPVHFPGAPFLLAAAFSALAILPFSIGRRLAERDR